MHFNPVKHGLVSSAMEWPYSSFRRYVEAGLYLADWGQGTMNFEGVGHEWWSRIVGLRCANPTYDADAPSRFR